MLSQPAVISRRRFFTMGAASAASLALPCWFQEELRAAAPAVKPRPPSGGPGIGLIGCGGQGRADARWAASFGEVVAVCDPDETRLNETVLRDFPRATKHKDFRKLLEQENVRVVINATPDHWHTLINIAALRAGKDVYAEKPLTLTIEEGQRLVQVTSGTGRILQTGTQQRSDDRFLLACQLVRGGRLGKLRRIITGLPTGPREGPFPPSPVPAGLDWDWWLGQTPLVPYVRQRCHGTFRFWYEYSGGMMTDWGAHHNDIAQWGNGTERSGPIEVEGRSLAGMIPGGYTTASHFRVEYKYANGVILVCKSAAPENTPNGVRFEGTDGWIFVSRSTLQASRIELLAEPLPSGTPRLYVSRNHMANFFNCVASRTPPICEPEIGHRSASVCHLGVIAMRLGRRLRWDPVNEVFPGDPQASAMLAREMRPPWSYETV